MIEIAVNARFRNRPVTGVERFATEVCRALALRQDVTLHEIDPQMSLAGLKGHAWEQLVLPRHRQGRLLFSPCNTGPVTVAQQFPVIHDAAVWDCPEGFSNHFGKLYRTLLPALAKKAKLVGTVSEFSKTQLAPRLGIPPEKIVVLGNAIDSRFQPAAEPQFDTSPTLLCVGSLDPRKNLNRLLTSWKSLRQTGRIPEKATLEIVGSANPKNFADFDLEEAPGVIWLGRLPDEELIARYQNATAFIFPSFYEGFGLPPLEAMACGCPVLLSRTASLPEVGGEPFDPSMRENGGTALYFDPMSTEEIESAMEKIFSLPEPDYLSLRERVITHSRTFSWEEIAGKTMSAFHRIVE